MKQQKDTTLYYILVLIELKMSNFENVEAFNFMQPKKHNYPDKRLLKITVN